MSGRGIERLRTAREFDERLKVLVQSSRKAEAELARALYEMKRRGLFRYLGYPRLEDYAEAELDLPGGKAKELAELAARLESLPKLRSAFEGGEIPWTKARQAARAATPEDEEAWVRRTQTLTSRGLERVVAAAKGERPKVKITLELTEAEAADLDEAVRRLREERREALPLASAVAELCRRAMGPPVDRPGFQIVVHECPSCGVASRDSRSGPIELTPEQAEAARVDAEILDLRGGGKGERRRTISPAERRAVIGRDRGRCRLCGTQHWLHIHHLDPRHDGPSELVLLCSACHKRLVHGRIIEIGGRAPTLEFRLANGSPAPRARDPV